MHPSHIPRPTSHMPGAALMNTENLTCELKTAKVVRKIMKIKMNVGIRRIRYEGMYCIFMSAVWIFSSSKLGHAQLIVSI